MIEKEIKTAVIRYAMTMFIICVAYVIYTTTYKSHTLPATDTECESKQIAHKQDTVNIETLLRKYLDTLHIEHADIAFATAVLETGWFRSDICINNHNLFGMKKCRNRPNTQTGVRKRYATYKSWHDSVLDYAIWYSIYCRNMTRNEMLNYISGHYSEDINYRKKIESIAKKY